MLIVDDVFFTEAELDPCLAYLKKATWSFGWRSNATAEVCYSHWNADISKTGRLHEEDVTHTLPPEFEPLWAKLKLAFPSATLVRCYANQHTFGTEGMIHTDTENDSGMTCIIYMNEEWSLYWGGETTFYDQDMTEIAKSVVPKYGRAAVFSGNIPHCARSVARTCDKARMTLMFKFIVDAKEVIPPEERLYNFLRKQGAHKANHKDGPLLGHLMRTYELMKAMGLAHDLCLAGGLHSIYGTQYFKEKTLPLTSTDVADAFGEEADRLARLFCSLNRPDDLKEGSSLNPEDLFAMCCIEVANLQDQDLLKYQPHLIEFWQKHTQT